MDENVKATASASRPITYQGNIELARELNGNAGENVDRLIGIINYLCGDQPKNNEAGQDKVCPSGSIDQLADILTHINRWQGETSGLITQIENTLGMNK